MTECSICLCPLRHTRTTKRLACGHEFHGACLDTWVGSGKGTCPMCRKVFQKTFKMTVRIENVHTGTSVEEDEYDDEAVEAFFASLGLGSADVAQADFEFPQGSLERIQGLLTEFGLQVDTSVLDAE